MRSISAKGAGQVAEASGKIAPAVGRAPEGARRGLGRLTPRVVGWTTFAVLVVVLALANRYVFSEHRYEDGDFAANSILIDQARHFRLLVGNYSRVGFNHPGPALLYVQALAQLAFHDLVPLARSAFGAHILGIILFEAAMVGLCATVIVRRTGSLVGAVVLVVAALVATSVEPGLLSSTWMPHVYTWPFLLLLVAATSVVSGESRDVWMVALAGGFLAHGHISFVMFVGVIGGAAAVAIVVRRVRRGGWGLDRRSVVATAGITALFALPIVANLVLHWPGELGRYRDYGLESGWAHGLADALHFVRLYWGAARRTPFVAAVLLGLAVLLALRSPDRGLRAFVVGGAASLGVASTLVVVYAMRGVDDLSLRYVGLFYLAVPILLATLVGIAVADGLRSLPAPGWARHPIPALTALGAAAVLVLVAAEPQLTNPYPGANWLPAASRAVEEQAPDGLVALRLDTPAWPVAAGIVEQARRDGREVCVVDNQALAVIFTLRQMCTPEQLARAHLIDVRLGGAAPAPGEVYADPFVRLAAGV